MTELDLRSDDPTDSLLDAAFPVALLVAAASWFPATVFLLGYAVRVLRAELVGDDGLPPLDDVRGLGWTGLRASAIVATISLPVAFCLGLAAVIPSVIGSRRYYGDALGFAFADPLGFVFADPLSYARFAVVSPGTSVAVAVALVLTGVVALVAGYACAVGLVAFAATNRLAAAFDPATIAGGFRSAAFRRRFLLASLLGGVGSGVVSLVALVPIVGPFAAAFAQLFVLVGVLRLVATGYEGRVVDRYPPHAEDVVDGDGGPQNAAA
ncbi:DUF4013 domain-containing protein [Salinigranum sp. GCM10025319]|uniref:DUF4013 domain-containing protein n=1 Tax=Salinigranum sp. GCM10025319 TaxID=3252687 RepID=UPI00360E50DA